MDHKQRTENRFGLYKTHEIAKRPSGTNVDTAMECRLQQDGSTSSDTDMCSCDSGCSPSWNSSSATTTPSYINYNGSGSAGGASGLKFTFDHKSTSYTDDPSVTCSGDMTKLMQNSPSHHENDNQLSESAPTSPRYSRGSTGPSTFAMLSERWRNRKGSSDSATSSESGSTKLSRLLRRTRSAGCSKDVPAHALFLRENDGRLSAPHHHHHFDGDRDIKCGKFRILAMDMKEKLTFSLRTKNLSESSVRPLPHEAKKWEESFMELLSSKYGIALFRIFLSREFSEENLEFWLACEKYKKSKPQKLKNKAKKIYENYIAFQAPNEVNLDTATRETTINNLSNPDYNSLDHAQRRVQGLMENDAYIRFLKSEMFLELSQQTSPTAENPDKTS